MLAALLNRGSLVNGPTNDGWTALHEAAANGHALIVDKLLATGAQVLLLAYTSVHECYAGQVYQKHPSRLHAQDPFCLLLCLVKLAHVSFLSSSFLSYLYPTFGLCY